MFQVAKCFGFAKPPYIDPEEQPSKEKIVKKKHVIFDSGE